MTPLTAPQHAATNLFNIFMEDAVRKAYTKNDMRILDKQYNQKSNVIARNIYRFDKSGMVTYQEGYCGDQGMLCFIVDTSGSMETEDNKEIIHMGPVSVYMKYDSKFTLSFDKLSCELEQFNTYLVICQWNKSTYTTQLQVYKYTHEEGLPIYRLRPEMYWFDLDNPVCDSVGSYNNDFEVKTKEECWVTGYPCMMTNIKLYNRFLGEEAVKEAMKYITQHEACVINDPARPIDSGHGYSVR